MENIYNDKLKEFMEQKIPKVKKDTIINIGIHYDYYILIKNTLLKLIEQLSDKKELENILKDFNAEKITSLESANVHVLSLLVKEIEDSAAQQGKVEDMTIKEKEDFVKLL